MASPKQPKKEDSMAGVPWVAIISAVPLLIDSAARLFTKADKPPASLPEIPDNSNNNQQVDAIIQRLEYFESLSSDQAKLLQQTIQQLQNVALSSATTSKRANIALGVSCLSVIVALVAIFLR